MAMLNNQRVTHNLCDIFLTCFSHVSATNSEVQDSNGQDAYELQCLGSVIHGKRVKLPMNLPMGAAIQCHPLTTYFRVGFIYSIHRTGTYGYLEAQGFHENRHISEAWRSGRSMKHSEKRQDATRFRIGITNLSISPQRLRFLRPRKCGCVRGQKWWEMLLEMVSMLQTMQIYQPRIILNHHESGIVRNHEESSWFIMIFFLKLSSRFHGNLAISKKIMVNWQCVKTLHPCSSHQNSW